MRRPKGPAGVVLFAKCGILAAALSFCGGTQVAADDLAPPASGVLDFNIIRKGDVIGHYHSDFVSRPDHALEVRTHVSAEVTMGPIRLYGFDHSSVETWRNGRLIGLVADTNDDGEVHHLNVLAADQRLAFVVDGKAANVTNGDAVPSSLWSRGMLNGDRPIFDVGDGQIFHTKTQCDVPLQPPAPIPSLCEVSGDLIRTLRFDSAGILAGLSFPVEDGSKVTYRPN